MVQGSGVAQVGLSEERLPAGTPLPRQPGHFDMMCQIDRLREKIGKSWVNDQYNQPSNFSSSYKHVKMKSININKLSSSRACQKSKMTLNIRIGGPMSMESPVKAREATVRTPRVAPAKPPNGR